MFIFVLGILVFLAGIGALIASKSEDWEALKPFSIGGIILSIILIVCSCIKVVPTGNTGIVTTFGKIENQTLDAGIHFMLPWNKVVNMDNRTQKETLEMGCFSSDIQEVTVSYTINYQINKKNAQEIYKNIGTEYYKKIVEPKALEAVKSVFAKYNAEKLIESRATLSKEIEAILRNDLLDYDIEIVATSIENIDFTDAFTNAVEAKQVAEQNKLKAKTEQEQATLEAEAKAERTKIEAKAKADSDIIAAQADADIAQIAADSAEYQGQKDAAIMSNLGEMLKAYPELIQYYKAIGWDGKLPETMLGNGTEVLIGVK